ncbi:DUF3307 domain-containing protein [Paraglaciecola sp. 2405UD69-4]|uniref:DUF3307 domain-containing protein n=1 Tax=Paraglaciecola sp. 2405UD69-4 TaxID=3391836 RepID=UPI0039C95203
MPELIILVALILVHILSDFYFQPSEWVTDRNLKHYKSSALYKHIAVHGVLSFAVFSLLGSNGWLLNLVYSGVIVGSHFVIDLAKSYAKKTTKNFVLDQLAHILVLLLLWAWSSDKLAEYGALYPLLTYKHLTLVVAYLIILKPTSILIAMILAPWTKELKRIEAALPKEHAKHSNSSLESAGMMIGYLERLLILTFIVLNQFSAIGFLLATKSVFRFGDLTNTQGKKLTEYVMLGTLTSFTITIFVGVATSAIVSSLPIGK